MKFTAYRTELLPIVLAIGAVPSAGTAEDREASADPVVFAAAETETFAASLPTPSPPVVRFGRAVDLAGADLEPESSSVAGTVLRIGSAPVGRPLVGGRLSSGFGMRGDPLLGGTRFHGGVDIAAAQGTPVFATSTGTVLSASWGGGYGILVRVSHDGSVETRYAHLSAVAVRAGDAVEAGQVIGYVGSTGRSTGPHLHYETRVKGHPVDPATAW